MVNFHHEDWNINLIGSYSGKRELLNSNINNQLQSLDSYWQFFTKLRYSLTPQTEFYAQIKNLSDDQFLTPPVNSSVITGVPNRGREILIGLTKQF